MKVLGPFAWLTGRRPSPTFPQASSPAPSERSARCPEGAPRAPRRPRSSVSPPRGWALVRWRLEARLPPPQPWIWGNDFQEFWEDFCLDAEKIRRKINLQHLCFFIFLVCSWQLRPLPGMNENLQYEVALGRHAIFREKGNQKRKTTSKHEQGIPKKKPASLKTLFNGNPPNKSKRPVLQRRPAVPHGSTQLGGPPTAIAVSDVGQVAVA